MYVVIHVLYLTKKLPWNMQGFARQNGENPNDVLKKKKSY